MVCSLPWSCLVKRNRPTACIYSSGSGQSTRKQGKPRFSIKQDIFGVTRTIICFRALEACANARKTNTALDFVTLSSSCFDLMRKTVRKRTRDRSAISLAVLQEFSKQIIGETAATVPGSCLFSCGKMFFLYLFLINCLGRRSSNAGADEKESKGNDEI